MTNGVIYSIVWFPKWVEASNANAIGEMSGSKNIRRNTFLSFGATVVDIIS